MSEQKAATPTEEQLRRSLRQQGLALQKDRARTVSINRQGSYRIIDADSNRIVAGERFDLALDDVAQWLDG